MTIQPAIVVEQVPEAPERLPFTNWSRALLAGFTEDGSVGDEVAFTAARVEGWRASFQPSNGFEDWLVEQAATLSVRVELCRKQDWALRLMAVQRAEVDWDGERRLAAEEEGAKIARKPALVSRRLRRSVQGCDWLLERWKGLAGLLRKGRDWDEAQRALALDMLGIAAELRQGETPLDPEGLSGDALRAARLAVAESEIAALEKLRDETLTDIDKLECYAALRGTPAEPDRAVLQVRRQEAALERRMHWALRQLLHPKSHDLANDAAPASPRLAQTPDQRPPSPAPVVAERPIDPPVTIKSPAPTPALPRADELPTLPIATAPIPVTARPRGLAGAFATSANMSASGGNRRERRARLSQERHAR